MSFFSNIGIIDGYGFSVDATPLGELRVTIPHRLVGSGFEGAILDPNFWTPTITSTGTYSLTNGTLVLSTGTQSSATASCVSVRTARYVGSNSNRYRGVINMSSGSENNIRRWGPFNSTDGAFFQLSGLTMSAVTRLNGSDTVVNNTSWNVDTTYPTITNVNAYEIYYTNSKVYFSIGDILKHTITATSSAWAATKTLPVRSESINTGSVTNNTITSWVQTICRLGDLSTGSTYKYVTGVTASVTAKYGAGNLHRVIVGGIANNAAVTLYDNTTASGTIIWASGAMPTSNNPNPFSLDFDDMPFFTGLSIGISTASANVTLIYE